MDKKTKSPAEMAAEEAEVALDRLAAQKKKDYNDRLDRKICFLEEQISALKRMKSDVWASIRSSIKDVNSRGEIIVRSVPGTATDYSLNAIVRSNFASCMERADAIDEAIETLKAFIGALKPTGSGKVPENLEAFCAGLVAKLPNRDEEEIVYAPEPKKEATEASPGEKK